MLPPPRSRARRQAARESLLPRASARAGRRRARRTDRSFGAIRGWAARARSCDREILMDQRDRHRALADGAGHALDRAHADVTGDEHAGYAGLERVWVARQRPAVIADV